MCVSRPGASGPSGATRTARYGRSLDDPDRLRVNAREGGLTGARVEHDQGSGGGGAALLEADPARAPNDHDHRLIKPSTGHACTAESVDQALSLGLPDLDIHVPLEAGVTVDRHRDVDRRPLRPRLGRGPDLKRVDLRRSRAGQNPFTALTGDSASM